MSNPIQVIGDGLIALRSYLVSKTEITSLIAATQFVTAIPQNPTYPYVVIKQVGGSAIWPAIDVPAFQIDVLTTMDNKVLCNQIARTIKAAIWAIANDRFSGVTLGSGTQEMPPTWIPDALSVPPIARYTARYHVLIH